MVIFKSIIFSLNAREETQQLYCFFQILLWILFCNWNQSFYRCMATSVQNSFKTTILNLKWWYLLFQGILIDWLHLSTGLIMISLHICSAWLHLSSLILLLISVALQLAPQSSWYQISHWSNSIVANIAIECLAALCIVRTLRIFRSAQVTLQISPSLKP